MFDVVPIHSQNSNKKDTTMKYTKSVILAALFMVQIFVLAQPKEEQMENQPKLFSFTMKTIDGSDKKLSEYKGNVLMIVNVASKCGHTPQYKGLEALYEKYKDRGFMILGFPANNFLWQEPHCRVTSVMNLSLSILVISCAV